MITPLQILEKYWGHRSFKPQQEEIIQAVCNGRDAVALLPTGGGKSICFQIPAIAQDGICIVVSPLVALMRDQINQLKERGIKAISLTGGISFNDLRTLLDNATYGNYKFLYLSPERLQQEVVQNAIKLMNVNLIAIDEAHCISQWGNDFRPSYKNITILRKIHPLKPIIALTATATPEVLEDTISELKLEQPQIFKTSYARKNLAYSVVKEEDKLYRIEQLLKHNTGSAIVYVRSRRAAVEISNQLNTLNITSAFYHGGLASEAKEKNMSAWINGTISTMVSTNAFGMGIDHPNVRFVIHVQLPESLESYFQEAGRAGRDGNYSSAVLLYSEYDKTLVKKQFVNVLPSPKDLKALYRTLNNYFQISYGEGEFTQHNFDFTDFCDTYNLNTINTYTALNTLDRLGVIQLSKEFGRKTIIRFLVSSEKVLAYFEKNSNTSVVGKTILRLYSGIFEAPSNINLDLVATKTGRDLSDIIPILKQFERDQLIELNLNTTDATLSFLVPREDDKTINPLAREVEELNRKKLAQVEAVLKYVENETECKSLQLVRYFGEENAEKCGICSVCAPQRSTASKKEVQLIAEKILALLEESDMSSRQISEKLTFVEAKIIYVLQLMIDAEKIGINIKKQYYLK